MKKDIDEVLAGAIAYSTMPTAKAPDF